MNPRDTLHAFLVERLGADAVLSEAEAMAPYREDYTEVEPRDPDLVAFVTSTEEVQAVVRKAAELKIPITPRVFGTNVGGLCIPGEGGLVLDFTRMNRVIEIDEEDMIAIIEPGVSQRILKAHLQEREIPLTLGYSLAPPDTSVFANALLGGLTNRSLKYGDQSESISGLEVVLPDGSLVRTGAWAVEGVKAYGRVPLPDLSGLFIAWQGTTGIATRMAFQLWPLHPLNKRIFFLSYEPKATFEVVRRLCRKEVCDDIGGLSWPSSKMMLGVQRPHPEPAEGEPTFFLYLDLTAGIPEEMAVKERIVNDVVDEMRRAGHEYEGPLDIETLVKVNPAMDKFAEFPTHLDFLTDHPGRGLTWIGTYGPLSRFTEGTDRATEVMVRRGFPPIIVSRPMRGGHFGVLRFIAVFDKDDPDEVAAVRALNRELLPLLTDLGFVMYKTPIWAWEALRGRIDPGFLKLMTDAKAMLDPGRLMNPGKLGL
jgi:FAD/FMN-containing dehydrogenase